MNSSELLCHSSYNNTLQATFKKFDVNNDGVLDEEEMIAVKKELEDASMKGFAVKGDGGGVRSEVLEAQMERIETFVVAVHGSCNTLHEEAMQVQVLAHAAVGRCCVASHVLSAPVQNSAGIKAVVKELQSLNASIQQLQARVMKMAGGKSDESGVKSKVSACFAEWYCCCWREVSTDVTFAADARARGASGKEFCERRRGIAVGRTG